MNFRYSLDNAKTEVIQDLRVRNTSHFDSRFWGWPLKCNYICNVDTCEMALHDLLTLGPVSQVIILQFRTDEPCDECS